MANALLNGITIGYDDKGPTDGTPLVLVHGHPFDRSMWAPQLAAFSGEFRVIAPDLRGFGESGLGEGRDRVLLSTFAEDLAALLDHLGVRDFVLGGLSMGGQIVMECYRQFGDRIRGLVLADTFPAAETAQGRTWRNSMADRLLREGMAPWSEEVLYKMVAPDADPAVAAHVLRMMTSAPPEGAAAAHRGRAERPDYRELLTRVSVPALVVVGRDDAYTPVADAEGMHAALADSTLCVVEGAAHMPNLERTEEFNAALGVFLARLD
ncbi:alpha/beta fold hydrolase [Streptomyces sp. T-3]|nr:alpha/beta fold hydrolase [Streptomyces sp. T-3]